MAKKIPIRLGRVLMALCLPLSSLALWNLLLAYRQFTLLRAPPSMCSIAPVNGQSRLLSSSTSVYSQRLKLSLNFKRSDEYFSCPNGIHIIIFNYMGFLIVFVSSRFYFLFDHKETEFMRESLQPCDPHCLKWSKQRETEKGRERQRLFWCLCNNANALVLSIWLLGLFALSLRRSPHSKVLAIKQKAF